MNEVLNTSLSEPAGREFSSLPRASHILIISDKPERLTEASNFLRSQLFRVSYASGWQGYYHAQAWRPDIVLVDGDMTQMDPLMMLRLLSQSAETGSIPAMLLAKPGHQHASEEAFAAGAVDCVPKPLYPEEVLARITVHLKNQHVPRWPVQTGLPQEDLLLRNALDAIQADVGSIHTIGQLARRIGTHERKLSAIFKSRTGKTAHKFIFEKKMATARRLLARTSMPVREIAQHVGFRSVCNFTVAFRRHESMTPTDYRRRAKTHGDILPEEPH